MGYAGAAGDGSSNSTGRPETVQRRQHARWAFHGLKGPWSRTLGSDPVVPSSTAAPGVVLSKQSCTTVAITGHSCWHILFQAWW